MSYQEYLEQTYAGWLGKIIGIRLGSPIEGWTYEQIGRVYDEINGYLVDYQDYAADDDSNGPFFFVRAIKDYSHDIEQITEKEMGDTWLNYAPENHGFFWWGGYGISTEHTAYMNLKYGIDAPVSGSIEQNGLACAQQIGGQIFSDCWGFVAPGNPELAARYAAKMAGVSHDGEGINGAKFVAGCISAAYKENHIQDVIRAGLSLLPETSEYVRMARDVMGYYQMDQIKSWRECFQFVKENYGYDKYPGSCHIIPNSAVMLLSMLYGEGDFSNTLCICNMCGWDTDCNAGNVGAILGVLVGIHHIEDKWVRPVNDLLLSSSVIGGLNITTVEKSAEFFCSLGCKIMGITPPEDWNFVVEDSNYHLHFRLPKSTQAMKTASNDKSAEIHTENTLFQDEVRCLKITANRLQSNTKVNVYHKTYVQPHDLHDSRYDPAFTPILYTGQTVKTALFNDSGFVLTAKIYIKDINNDKIYLSEAYELCDRWTELEYRIPVVESCLIKEAGVVIYRSADTKVNDKCMIVFMKYLEFAGEPVFNINFSKEKIENYGFGHSTLHREISQFTYKNGLWELDHEYLSGSCSDEGESYTGYYYHKDYSYECIVNPQRGNHHMVLFRVQGAIRHYGFGFYGDGQVALVKRQKNRRIVISEPYEYEMGKDYRFRIEVKDHRITAYIDEKVIIEYEDVHAYNYGQIGLGVYEGSHCHYKDIVVKSC